MIKLLQTLLTITFAFSTGIGLSQNAAHRLEKILTDLQISTPSNGWHITSEHVSATSKIHHIYYQQTLNNIPVKGTESSVHFSSEGHIITQENNTYKDVSELKKFNKTPGINAVEAVKLIAAAKKYTVTSPLKVKNDLKSDGNDLVLSHGGISERDIPAKLMYILNEKGELSLAWEISILELGLEHWWTILIDANTGMLLKEKNRIANCAFGVSRTADLEFDFNKNLVNRPFNKPEASYDAAICENCYEVFAVPVQSPYYGERTIVENPAHPLASPLGWHDTDGQPGPESKFTEGNNAEVIEGSDNFGFQPFGGDRLEFTGYPFQQFFSGSNQYESSAITNLFYWTNMFHDIFYVYGFTEAAGNFQQNSYGRGGQPNDRMRVQGQRNLTGSCAAFFGFAEDGYSPIMILGTCDNKDGSYDSVVIAHEYGHGITSRLVGGPGNIECFENNEQMSEGWCDWFGTILTIQPGDIGLDKRQIGNYYFDKAPDRNGIRRFPYTTDMTINPQTYGSIGSSAIPHGVGAVWANMLWEMTWKLIEVHGFDPDVTNFTGDSNQDAGNVVALALVTEALKLTPCQPGFVSARDAILQADLAIYNGYNQCFIWNAFAKRGLGLNAAQGSTNSTSDGFPNFEGFIDYALLELDEERFCYEENILTGITGGIPIGGVYTGLGVIDDSNGISFSLDLEVAGLGIHQLTYAVDKSQCANASSDTISFEIILDEEPPEIGCPANDLEVTISGNADYYLLPDYSESMLITDFCSDDLAIVQTPDIYTEMPVGLHVIEITATDNVGNESSCQFKLRVFQAISGNFNDSNSALNSLELIKIYPNPNSGQLTLSNPFEIKIDGIQIRDMLGRFIDQRAINNSEKENTFNIELLAAGSYFITVTIKSESKVFRLVKR